MSSLIKNILILVLILIAAGYAFSFIMGTLGFLIKLALIGGGAYLGYKIFFSKNKQIEK